MVIKRNGTCGRTNGWMDGTELARKVYLLHLRRSEEIRGGSVEAVQQKLNNNNNNKRCPCTSDDDGHFIRTGLGIICGGSGTLS